MQRALLAIAILGATGGCPAQQLAHPSPYSQSVWSAETFTGTGQWTTIQLNDVAPTGSSFASAVGSSFSSGTITLTGTSLASVTFSVMGSSDNGKTFYALPISTVATPAVAPTTVVTATASGLYRVNLVGVTHVRFTTLGLFAATKVSLALTASPN